jgi:two-component system response regulator (stage 0 sporulation protein F)
MTSSGPSSSASEVLVVEDDPNLREVYADVLAAEGYEVSVAANGREALAILGDGAQPCAVVLDLRMPVMSGWDLAAKMRDTRQWQSLPIIVVAAHYLVADEARRIGAAAWLQKPVSLTHLVSAVHSACEVAGRPREGTPVERGAHEA